MTPDDASRKMCKEDIYVSGVMTQVSWGTSRIRLLNKTYLTQRKRKAYNKYIIPPVKYVLWLGEIFSPTSRKLACADHPAVFS